MSESSRYGLDTGPSEFPKVGDILEDRYELLRLIGKGGMGVVMEGMQIALNRRVAIKLMHSHLADVGDFARRFEREILIAKELMHPNTVRIYDLGTTAAGLMYLVMEFLEGEELSDQLAAGQMSTGRVLELSQQILDGLGEAHAMNVVHRDLKPSNIFITRDRREREVVKILDFGIAKSLSGNEPEITRAGQFVGTARYVAPELLQEAEATKAADTYACGLIFLEMLYGRPIIDGPILPKTLQLHAQIKLILPRTLENHPLGAFLERAVDKSPLSRFPDAEAMHAALVELSQSGFEDLVIPKREIDAVMKEMYAAVGVQDGWLLSQAQKKTRSKPSKPDLTLPMTGRPGESAEGDKTVDTIIFTTEGLGEESTGTIEFTDSLLVEPPGTLGPNQTRSSLSTVTPDKTKRPLSRAVVMSAAMGVPVGILMAGVIIFALFFAGEGNEEVVAKAQQRAETTESTEVTKESGYLDEDGNQVSTVEVEAVEDQTHEAMKGNDKGDEEESVQFEAGSDAPPDDVVLETLKPSSEPPNKQSEPEPARREAKAPKSRPVATPEPTPDKPEGVSAFEAILDEYFAE